MIKRRLNTSMLQYRKKYQKKKSYWLFGVICLYLHPQKGHQD